MNETPIVISELSKNPSFLRKVSKIAVVATVGAGALFLIYQGSKKFTESLSDGGEVDA